MGCQLLTNLISESLSGHTVVQILRVPTSKNVSALPVFNDFDFRSDLVLQRGASFGDEIHFTSKNPSAPLTSSNAMRPFFGSFRWHESCTLHLFLP